MGGPSDITGKRNGRLVAVRRVGLTDDSHALWLCQCDCGNTKLVGSNNLRYGTPEKPQGTISRVGTLKGYGNSIVGPLAATFIEAVMEVLFDG